MHTPNYESGLVGLPQPHRREPDLSPLESSEASELMRFVRRLRRAGGFEPATMRLVLSEPERQRCDELAARVAWKEVAMTPPTNVPERDPLMDARLRNGTPMLDQLEEVVEQLADRLNVSTRLLYESDPRNPAERLGAVIRVLTVVDRDLTRAHISLSPVESCSTIEAS
jgi:hypothetical protein